MGGVPSPSPLSFLFKLFFTYSRVLEVIPQHLPEQVLHHPYPRSFFTQLPVMGTYLHPHPTVINTSDESCADISFLVFQ